MAKKNLLTRSFSPAEIAEYSELTVKIEGAQKQADGLARTIAGALSRIKSRKLYEYQGYKNIYEYGEQRHGIARGTVSDAINVYERFQNPDNKGTLLPEFEPFAWRALIMLKSIPDNDSIHKLGITYDMKSAEIKQRVADYKEASELIELKGDWNYDTVKQAIDDTKAIETSGSPIEDSLEDNQADGGEAGNSEEESTSELAVRDSEVRADDSEVSKPDYKSIAENMMTPEQWEEFSTAEESDIEDACEDYVDNFMTFPKRTVDLSKMNNKDALALIKSLLDGARNNEYDIIITG